MSSSETHHPAVCVAHTTTGVLRHCWRESFCQKIGWFVLTALYVFLGVLVEGSIFGLIAWEAFFTSAWTFIWFYLPHIND